MAITVTCPCGLDLNVKDALGGKRIRCPSCRQVLAVPEAAAPVTGIPIALEAPADELDFQQPAAKGSWSESQSTTGPIFDWLSKSLLDFFRSSWNWRVRPPAFTCWSVLLLGGAFLLFVNAFLPWRKFYLKINAPIEKGGSKTGRSVPSSANTSARAAQTEL